MIAVLAGATGLVGSAVLKRLLADAAFSKVVVLGRRPSGVQNPKLNEVLVASLADLHAPSQDLLRRLGGEVYFSCLGTTIRRAGSQAAFREVDVTAVGAFARIAAHHKAKKFLLVSASGASAKSLVFYNRAKAEAEELVRATVGEGRLTAALIARPGLLLGERTEVRRGEAFAIAAFHVLEYLIPNTVLKYAGTSVERLADVLCAHAKISTKGTEILEAAEI